MSKNAKIIITFDKEIATDPNVENGSELKKISCGAGTVIYSTQYSSTYSAAKAFDEDTSDYWRPSTADVPQYIGKDFGSAITIGKIRVYLNASYSPNAYKIQGSDNGVDYNDVHSGNFVNITGWAEVTFAAATYRYWRLYITSITGSYMYIKEFEFYRQRPTYANTAGWMVRGQEYTEIPPNDDTVEIPYTVYRVTKTEDNMGLILWLDFDHRMKYPQGTISIQYNASTGGNIRSTDGGKLANFIQTFSPTDITPPEFNPNDLERVEITNVSLTTNLILITYSESANQPQGNTELTTASIISMVLTHVNDL